MNSKTLGELAEILTADHLRERIDPRPGDKLYLHLSDLLLALKEHATDEKTDMLDFGAGVSPYRSIFPNANYRRADFSIGTGEGLDYRLDESLKIDAPDESFDLILSTQVLEHVVEPEDYLRECFRLLRPGGALVLTTHGIYADHPCPYDLHRWTADGLGVLGGKAGFEVKSVKKLTTDARALFFLYDLYGRQTHRRAFSLFSALFALQYRLYRGLHAPIHRWVDRFLPHSRVVDHQAGSGHIYINLLIHAAKPVAGSS